MGMSYNNNTNAEINLIRWLTKLWLGINSKIQFFLKIRGGTSAIYFADGSDLVNPMDGTVVAADVPDGLPTTDVPDMGAATTDACVL